MFLLIAAGEGDFVLQKTLPLSFFTVKPAAGSPLAVTGATSTRTVAAAAGAGVAALAGIATSPARQTVGVRIQR
jgi:hypothetical protein